MEGVLHDQGQQNDFLRCRVRGGHGPHDLLAMGEEKLTANMGAESIMDTVTGEQRVQPVRGARGPATTRRAHPQTC